MQHRYLSAWRLCTLNVAWLILIAITPISVLGATPGLPFTEDFTDTNLQDPGLTTANWDTDKEALVLAKYKQRYGVFDNATGTDVNTAQATLSIALADLDGDGDIDVLEGNNNQANRLFLNNGTGDPFNGVTPINVGTAQATRSIVMADLDG